MIQKVERNTIFAETSASDIEDSYDAELIAAKR